MAVSKSFKSKGTEVPPTQYLTMKGSGSTRGTGSGGTGNPQSAPLREQVMGKSGLSGTQKP